MKAAGFLGGQFGDLVIQTVCCRAFKALYPNSHLTFACAEKFRDILPLFFNHPHIDDHHVWEGYDAAWPTQTDRAYVEWRGYNQVFNAMAEHVQPDWFNHRHYGQEACARFGLPIPADYSYHLNPWMPLRKDCGRVVTLTLFPSKGTQMDKGLRVDEAEKLCVALKAKGYQPVQLGGRFEVALQNAVAPSLSILEATTLMLSSALHITADTGFSSIAAGYNHRVLGFYGQNYPNLIDNRTQIPPNRNAHYIRHLHPQAVTAEHLLAAIEEHSLLPA